MDDVFDRLMLLCAGLSVLNRSTGILEQLSRSSAHRERRRLLLALLEAMDCPEVTAHQVDNEPSVTIREEVHKATTLQGGTFRTALLDMVVTHQTMCSTMVQYQVR